VSQTKLNPDGSLLKHKVRLCTQCGMQIWKDNYWKTYSPVINVMSPCLLTSIAKIHNRDTKVKDFVFTFPQAELEINIWMYIPIESTSN